MTKQELEIKYINYIQINALNNVKREKKIQYFRTNKLNSLFCEISIDSLLALYNDTQHTSSLDNAKKGNFTFSALFSAVKTDRTTVLTTKRKQGIIQF